jgi:hypothetical protein
MKRMSRRSIGASLLLLLILLAAWGAAAASDQGRPGSAEAIASPALKWQHGGCYSSWCETGWYASPAVADLDGDGRMEVIAAAYSLFVLNGEDGSLQWSADPPGSRVWPGVVVADLDDDGDLEVVTGQGGGYLNVYDHAGNLVWSRQPASSELRGLSAYDLEGDGTLELIVTAAVGSKTNTWVLSHQGDTLPGWPQLNNDSGYAWGVFNDNAAIGDMDGDGVPEIVVPSDVHYINAYETTGAQIPTHPMYGGKGWGKVGVHVDHAVDLRGYAHCGTEHRPNFAHSPATMADVNGDGATEVIVVGNVYNCGTSPYTSLYEMPFLFNADRSRWQGDGFDWVAIPVPDGAAGPLSEDYNVVESAMPNPVAADLDGDGFLEILYASYDGRLHAYWLDKTEHHNWPYNVAATGPGIRFASEPVVADLNDDGQAEVLFTSWPQKGSSAAGKLHLLNSRGEVLQEVDLPAAYGSPDWNGALAAPTLANIDADADLEVVLNTAHSGFVAYDLPGTAGARILWGTGRGNFQRTGGLLVGSLDGSIMSMSPPAPGPGDTLTVTIYLKNAGPALEDVKLTNPMPAPTIFAGGLTASSGTATYSGGQVTWSGAVPGGQPVIVQYHLAVKESVTTPTLIVNRAEVDDGLGSVGSLSAAVMANGLTIHLPSVRH